MLWFSLGSDHCMFRYLCIVVVFSSFLFFGGAYAGANLWCLPGPTCPASWTLAMCFM